MAQLPLDPNMRLNPTEMCDKTNNDYLIKLARQTSRQVVCIHLCHFLSAVGLADEWIPIRPGTDVAITNAMACVISSEKLYSAEDLNSPTFMLQRRTECCKFISYNCLLKSKFDCRIIKRGERAVSLVLRSREAICSTMSDTLLIYHHQQPMGLHKLDVTAHAIVAAPASAPARGNR